jgi:sec-independent protein translocase protein TatA
LALKKLRGIGSDLGGAVKGFKDSVSSDPKDEDTAANEESVEKKQAAE